MSGAWDGNWKKRIYERLRALGFASLADYMNQKPSESYVTLADDLGKDDVSAFHVEWLYFEESIKKGQFRSAAMDSLIREIDYHLPNGWKLEAKGDFDTAGVWADWIACLTSYSNDIRPVAEAVWSELKRINPPAGWKPRTIEDRLISKAFDAAWPHSILIQAHLVSRPNS